MQLGRTQDFEDHITVAHPKTANIAGLAGGTTVITMSGETLVEDLKVGDRIITRDAGMSVLREIRSSTVKVMPISIKAGSLGHTRPECEIIVGPDTLIHIRDWRAKALFDADVATVKAKRLIDSEFVTEESSTTLTTYELVFDRQHIIYASGLEIATANA